MRLRTIFIMFLLVVSIGASAKFVQEVELKDGTILVGYVYRQQPSRFMVFHADHVRKDPKSKYLQQDKNYMLQWKDIKYIRHSAESDEQWCDDKVTLKNGTVYWGQIEEQEVGVSMKMRIKDTGKKVVVNNNDIKISEKVAVGFNDDLWTGRQYTNRLKLTDDSIHDGLIVLQYRGESVNDSYVELLHASGYRERIFFPDIKEYIMLLR